MPKLAPLTFATIRLLAVMFSAVFADAVFSQQRSDRAGPPPHDSNEQTLEELDRQLLDGLAPAPAKSKNHAPPTSKAPAVEPEGSPRAGEDLGQAQANPLLEISQRMREVERQLASRQTEEPTLEIQQQIVRDLERLIEQAAQQSSSKGSSGSQGGRQAAASAPPPANSAARESSDRLGSSDASSAREAAAAAGERDVWGHLPDRLREQIRNAAIEQFLPKYEQMIEQYYKRLADEASVFP